MDARYPIPTGRLAARLHGARMTLIEWSASAVAEAGLAQIEGRTEFAASLRGKARGYSEAADVILALERQRRLPRRWRRYLSPRARTG